MPMKPKTKLVKILLTNIMIAFSISLVASYIAISRAGVPAEAFVPALIGSTLLNTVLAYIISFFVGWFLPTEKWGFDFATKTCHLSPADGLKFGATLNVVVNSVYVFFNSIILTWFNACVRNGAPLIAIPGEWASSIIQCWIVGFVVSLFWAPACEKWARQICNDPAPEAPQGGAPEGK